MSRKNWTSDKIFQRLQKNKTQKTYWDNISELRRRPNHKVFTKAVELTSTDDDKSIIIGLDVLQQLGFNPRYNTKDTIKIHFKLLEQPQSNNVLKSIFYGIGHNNEKLTKKQIDKLIEFQNNENTEVKHSLISALSGIENSKAIKTLIYFSKSRVPSIRNWSTFGLASLIESDNKQIREALWGRIEDIDFDTKSEAIMGLAIRNDERIKEIILSELRNGSYGTLILESIAILKDIDFLKPLEVNLKKSKKENDGWTEALKETISEIKITNA